MIYLPLIAVCVLIISLTVSLACSVSFWYTLGFSSLAVVIVIAIDGLVAAIARFMPKSIANHEKKIFVVSAKEKKFYEKLKIRKWKDKVPEIGHFTGFRKNKLDNPQSVEYLDRFLLEACYGEVGHFFSLFFGFALLLFYPLTPIWLHVAIPVAIINIFFNLPSLFILRYTTYKLKILRKNLIKKQNRKLA